MFRFTMYVKSTLLTILFCTCVQCKEEKRPVKYEEKKPSAKYDNPGFIRDRHKDEIQKPEMPEHWKNRLKRPFNKAWMDYCDPYHCDAYHKVVCGLNRATMRFKWFQSVCHLVINNMCSNYRGFLKYDMVETKHCYKYVMQLRTSCPAKCEEHGGPVCAMSVTDRHAVLFESQCAMATANCEPESLNDYEEVSMAVCTLFELFKMYGYTY